MAGNLSIDINVNAANALVGLQSAKVALNDAIREFQRFAAVASRTGDAVAASKAGVAAENVIRLTQAFQAAQASADAFGASVGRTQQAMTALAAPRSQVTALGQPFGGAAGQVRGMDRAEIEESLAAWTSSRRQMLAANVPLAGAELQFAAAVSAANDALKTSVINATQHAARIAALQSQLIGAAAAARQFENANRPARPAPGPTGAANAGAIIEASQGAILDETRAKYDRVFAAALTYRKEIEALNNALGAGDIDLTTHANELVRVGAAYEAAAARARELYGIRPPDRSALFPEPPTPAARAARTEARAADLDAAFGPRGNLDQLRAQYNSAFSAEQRFADELRDLNILYGTHTGATLQYAAAVQRLVDALTAANVAASGIKSTAGSALGSLASDTAGGRVDPEAAIYAARTAAAAKARDERRAALDDEFRLRREYAAELERTQKGQEDRLIHPDVADARRNQAKARFDRDLEDLRRRQAEATPEAVLDRGRARFDPVFAARKEFEDQKKEIDDLFAKNAFGTGEQAERIRGNAVASLYREQYDAVRRAQEAGKIGPDEAKGEFEKIQSSFGAYVAGLGGVIGAHGKLDGAMKLNRQGLLELQAAGVNTFQAMAAGMNPLHVAMMEGAQVIGSFIQGGRLGLSALTSQWGMFAVAGAGALAAVGYAAYQLIERLLAVRGLTERFAMAGAPTGPAAGTGGAREQAAGITEMLSKQFRETGGSVRSIQEELNNLPASALSSAKAIVQLAEASAAWQHTDAVTTTKEWVAAAKGGPEAFLELASSQYDLRGAVTSSGQALADWVKVLHSAGRDAEAFQEIATAVSQGAGGQGAAARREQMSFRAFLSARAPLENLRNFGTNAPIVRPEYTPYPKLTVADYPRQLPPPPPEIGEAAGVTTSLTPELTRREELQQQLVTLKKAELVLESQLDGALMTGNNAVVERLQTQLRANREAQVNLGAPDRPRGAGEERQDAAKMARLQIDLRRAEEAASHDISQKQRVLDKSREIEAEETRIHQAGVEQRKYLTAEELRAQEETRQRARTQARQEAEHEVFTPIAITQAQNPFDPAVQLREAQKELATLKAGFGSFPDLFQQSQIDQRIVQIEHLRQELARFNLERQLFQTATLPAALQPQDPYVQLRSARERLEVTQAHEQQMGGQKATEQEQVNVISHEREVRNFELEINQARLQAQQIVAQSHGDLAKIVDLRRQDLALIEASPDKNSLDVERAKLSVLEAQVSARQQALQLQQQLVQGQNAFANMRLQTRTAMGALAVERGDIRPSTAAITELGVARQTMAENEARQKALRDAMEAANAPVEGRARANQELVSLYEQDAQKQIELQTQITSAIRAENERRIENIKDFFKTIESGATSAFASVATGQKKFADALKDLRQNIVSSLITNVEQMLSKAAGKSLAQAMGIKLKEGEDTSISAVLAKAFGNMLGLTQKEPEIDQGAVADKMKQASDTQKIASDEFMQAVQKFTAKANEAPYNGGRNPDVGAPVGTPSTEGRKAGVTGSTAAPGGAVVPGVVGGAVGAGDGAGGTTSAVPRVYETDNAIGETPSEATGAPAGVGAAAGAGTGTMVSAPAAPRVYETDNAIGSTAAALAPMGVYEAIARAEGTFKNGAIDYNAIYGNGKFGTPPKPLTEMTLAEARDFGKEFGPRTGVNTSAMGAFQIQARSTMLDAARDLGMDLNTTKFTPEVQRQMAEWVRQNQGFGAWEGFKAHPELLQAARAAIRSGESDTTTAASTPPEPPAASMPATTSFGPVAFGDSIAAHLIRKAGVEGQESGRVAVYRPGDTAVSGYNPQQVLDVIKQAPGSSIQGRDVVLSSGASNIAGTALDNQEQIGRIGEQIETLQQRGARSVELLGVGTAPRLAGVNERLAEIASQRGAIFAGPLRSVAADQIHAANNDDLLRQIRQAREAAPGLDPGLDNVGRGAAPAAEQAPAPEPPPQPRAEAQPSSYLSYLSPISTAQASEMPMAAPQQPQTIADLITQGNARYKQIVGRDFMEDMRAAYGNVSIFGGHPGIALDIKKALADPQLRPLVEKGNAAIQAAYPGLDFEQAFKSGKPPLDELLKLKLPQPPEQKAPEQKPEPQPQAQPKVDPALQPLQTAATQAGQAVQQLGTAATNAQSSVQQAGQAATTASQSLEQAGSSAGKVGPGLQTASTDTTELGSSVSQAAAQAKQAGDQFQQAGQAAAEGGQRMGQAGTQTGTAPATTTTTSSDGTATGGGFTGGGPTTDTGATGAFQPGSNIGAGEIGSGINDFGGGSELSTSVPSASSAMSNSSAGGGLLGGLGSIASIGTSLASLMGLKNGGIFSRLMAGVSLISQISKLFGSGGFLGGLFGGSGGGGLFSGLTSMFGADLFTGGAAAATGGGGLFGGLFGGFGSLFSFLPALFALDKGGILPSAAGGTIVDHALPSTVKSGLRALAANSNVGSFASSKIITHPDGGLGVNDGKGGRLIIGHPGEMVVPPAETRVILNSMKGGSLPSAAGGMILSAANSNWQLPSSFGPRAAPAMAVGHDLVLPNRIGQGFQALAGGPGARLGGGDVHNTSITVSAIDSRSGAQFLMNNADVIASALGRARRNFRASAR